MKKRDLDLTEYDISKYQFRTLYNLCLTYPEMIQEVKSIESTGSSQKDGRHDSTAQAALRLARLKDYVHCIEQAALRADSECYKDLLKVVGTDSSIAVVGYPRGKNQFRNARRKFYYELSKMVL